MSFGLIPTDLVDPGQSGRGIFALTKPPPYAGCKKPPCTARRSAERWDRKSRQEGQKQYPLLHACCMALQGREEEARVGV